MHGKAEVHDGRRGDHNNLKNPESNVRQRGESIIAYIFTTRLLRVAHKLALFILIDGLTAHHCQDNSEDDEEREPDLSHKSGMVGDLVKQARQEAPTHVGTNTRDLSDLDKIERGSVIIETFQLGHKNSETYSKWPQLWLTEISETCFAGDMKKRVQHIMVNMFK